jgi:hypothetical protein
VCCGVMSYVCASCRQTYTSHVLLCARDTRIRICTHDALQLHTEATQRGGGFFFGGGPPGPFFLGGGPDLQQNSCDDHGMLAQSMWLMKQTMWSERTTTLRFPARPRRTGLLLWRWAARALLRRSISNGE